MEIVLSDRTIYSGKFEGTNIEVVYRHDYVSGKCGIYTKIGGV